MGFAETRRAACADRQAFWTQPELQEMVMANIEGRIDGHLSWQDCDERPWTTSKEQRRTAHRNGTPVRAELIILRH